MALSVLQKVNDNTLSNLNRRETSLEARFGLNHRRTGLNLSVSGGRTKDPVSPDLDPYRSATASVFATRGSSSFNVSGSYIEGPTFYNPVEKQRVTLGANWGWDSGKSTTLNSGFFLSRDLAFTSHQFALADVRVSHQFRSGHRLTMRGRMAQTDFDASIRNATLSATYTIPLSVRAPGVATRGSTFIRGRVYDVETNEALPGVLLTFASESTVTADDGSFTLPASSAEVGYLSIDRQSIGFDRRPVDVFPMAISMDPSRENPLDIGVIRSAEVSVALKLKTEIANDRMAALSRNLGAEDLAGLVIEARSDDHALRRLTDRSGIARFPDLLPGTWRLFVVGRFLPEGYKTVPDTTVVVLGAADEHLVTLLLEPRARSIKFVSSGGVSLAKPERDPNEFAEPQPDFEVVTDPGPELQVHLVAEGETLSILARQYFGSTIHWIRIWRSNEATLPNPDLITLGARLVIPGTGPLTPTKKAALLGYVEAAHDED